MIHCDCRCSYRLERGLRNLQDVRSRCRADTWWLPWVNRYTCNLYFLASLPLEAYDLWHLVLCTKQVDDNIHVASPLHSSAQALFQCSLSLIHGLLSDSAFSLAGQLAMIARLRCIWRQWATLLYVSLVLRPHCFIEVGVGSAPEETTLKGRCCNNNNTVIHI